MGKMLLPENYISISRKKFDNNNMLLARFYIKEGLEKYPDNKELYHYAFWMEVGHNLIVNKYTKNYSCATVLETYQNLLKVYFGDLEFIFDLLDKILKLHDLRELVFHIIKDMVKNHLRNELMWKKLATLNLNGCIFDLVKCQLLPDTTSKIRVEFSILTYEAALIELPLSDKLLIFYLDHLIEIRKSYFMQNKSIKNYVNKITKEIIHKALDQGIILSTDQCMNWLDLAESNEEFRNILMSGVWLGVPHVNHPL